MLPGQRPPDSVAIEILPLQEETRIALNAAPAHLRDSATATILPKVVFIGDALVRGVPLQEVERQLAEKFASGEFIAPRRPGIAYMLTREICNYNPQTGEVGTFPPHIMFYVSNLTDRDIGTTWDRDARGKRPWLPFVGYQGPHGFIIVVVEEP